MARLNILLTSEPYKDSTAQDGIEFAIAATNYGHDSVIFFIDSGVLQLSNKQTTPPNCKSILKQLNALPFYDIEEMYASSESMEHLGITTEELGVSNLVLLSDEQIKQKISQNNHTITF